MVKFDKSDKKREELETRIRNAIKKHPESLQWLMYRAYRWVVFTQRG